MQVFLKHFFTSIRLLSVLHDSEKTLDFVNWLVNSFSPLLLKLANDPNVVIAKMDATANDVPSPYEVSG